MPTSRSVTRALPLRAALALALTTTAVSATACAGARASTSATAAVDPVGQYSYTSQANGADVSGTITISRTDAGFRGVMTTGGLSRDLVFEHVRASGNRVTMESTAGASRVAVDFTRNGDAISGTWTMGAMGGSLRGRRVTGS